MDTYLAWSCPDRIRGVGETNRDRISVGEFESDDTGHDHGQEYEF